MSSLDVVSVHESVESAITADASEPYGQGPTINDPIRVILVSDELITRVGLRHFLEASGVIVVAETTAGEAAIRLIQQERPHIVLLDADSCSGTVLPWHELLEGNVRLIVLCERAHAAANRTWLEVGAMGLVIKDEPPAVLIKAICKVHQGEAWVDRVKTAEVLVYASRQKRAAGAEQTKIASLTARERQIIALVGEGLKNAVIAQRLLISQSTVRNHLTSVLEKLGVSNRFELAVYTFRHGLVRYPAPNDGS
jgi:DNA-binding NarL/FixJ family response regulator